MNRRTLRRAVAGVMKEAASIQNGVAIPESKRNDSTGSRNGNGEQVSERHEVDRSRG